MQIYVFTDGKGKIVGSYRPPQTQAKDAPQVSLDGIKQRGQNVQVVELPAALENVKNPVELHQQLAKLVKP